MSERTGLGPLEVAALRAVAAAGGVSSSRYRSTRAVLDRLETEHGVGPSYALLVLRDLGAGWCVHLPLLDHEGNWGSVDGDLMADPEFTRIRLSPLGALALEAEAGGVGPIPFGLVEGSLYRRGRVPPLEPGRVLAALALLSNDATAPDRALLGVLGPPSLPSGGTVSGRLSSLYYGRRTRLRLSCRVEREHTSSGAVLVISGIPPGQGVREIAETLAGHLTTTGYRRHETYLVGQPREPIPLSPARDIRNETVSRRSGIRVVVVPRRGLSLDEVEDWLLGLWPLTVEVTCRFPTPVSDLLRSFAADARQDRSGLEELARLIGAAGEPA